jgi:hypothetical protein
LSNYVELTSLEADNYQCFNMKRIILYYLFFMYYFLCTYLLPHYKSLRNSTYHFKYQNLHLFYIIIIFSLNSQIQSYFIFILPDYSTSLPHIPYLSHYHHSFHHIIYILLYFLYFLNQFIFNIYSLFSNY